MATVYDIGKVQIKFLKISFFIKFRLKLSYRMCCYYICIDMR